MQINAFNVSLPDGQTKTFDFNALPEDRKEHVLNELLKYAVGVIAQRALAGQGALTSAAKTKLVSDKINRLQSGDYNFGHGSRESDPLVIELRAMADQAARDAKWKLTASREFVKENGPVYGIVAAKLMQAGKMGSGSLVLRLIEETAAKNEAGLMLQAQQNLDQRSTEIVL